MPHLTLEFSENVAPRVDCAAAFASLHTALMEFETFPLADIKSRAVCHRIYCVGNGAEANGFVHLTLALLSGRDISVRQRMTEACLKILTQVVAVDDGDPDALRINVSVELREMDRATYGKHQPPAPL
jgi:5-carboxymethyl-2-hydroxymuconate isomerase